jgi:phosphatidylglycerophosphate synthase
MSAGRVIAASSWGKAKMVVQVITVSFLLTPLRSMTLGPIAIGGVLIGIMTLVTIWSGADYLILNRDLFRKENSED